MLICQSKLEKYVNGLWEVSSALPNAIGTGTFENGVNGNVGKIINCANGIIIKFLKAGTYSLPNLSFVLSDGFSFQLGFTFNNSIAIGSDGGATTMVIGKGKNLGSKGLDRFSSSWYNSDGLIGGIKLSMNTATENFISSWSQIDDQPHPVKFESLGMRNITGLKNDEFIGIWFVTDDEYNIIKPEGTLPDEPFYTYGLNGAILDPIGYTVFFDTGDAALPINSIQVKNNTPIILPMPIPIGNTIAVHHWIDEDNTKYAFGQSISFESTRFKNLKLIYTEKSAYSGLLIL